LLTPRGRGVTNSFRKGIQRRLLLKNYILQVVTFELVNMGMHNVIRCLFSAGGSKEVHLEHGDGSQLLSVMLRR